MRVMLQRLSRIPKMGLFLANRQTKRCGCAKKKPSPGGEVAAQPTEGDLRAKRCGYPFGQNALKSKYSHSPSVACGASFPPGDAFAAHPLPVYKPFMGSFNLMTFSPQWNEVDRGTRKTSIILTLFFQEPTNLICIKAKISPAKAGHVRMITVILIPIRPNGDRLGFRA